MQTLSTAPAGAQLVRQFSVPRVIGY